MLIPRLKGLKMQWQLLLALKEACSKNKMLPKMTATLTLPFAVCTAMTLDLSTNSPCPLLKEFQPR